MTSNSVPSVERERLPPHLWLSVWALLEGAVEVATADAAAFATHEPMLCALLTRTSELYAGGRSHFDESDVKRMLRLAEHEWDSIVDEATRAHGRAPHAFDADQ